MSDQTEAIQARIDKASRELGALCAGQKFRMSIPVQPTDSDSVLSDALVDAQTLLAERKELYARADHATTELLALGRELRQAREERDALRSALESARLDNTAMLRQRDEAQAEVWDWRNRLAERCDERDRAVAEAATLRLSLSTALSGYSDLLDAAEPIDEAESGRYTEEYERISKECEAILNDSTCAARAAAVLAVAGKYADRLRAYGNHVTDTEDALVSAVDAYRAALKGVE